ncbi:mannose-1-phosphate guanylyltransferase [Zhouia amylolytica]|uniref:mannose-1-phosphate guanylyltransferase n=1 Tax=Zhouia amylolytica TaxID=376730 RepID=UPI0020CD82E4|nr:mannose-1-phosphate guanylyltransferase [Zhouia amylolytica]MCQ0113117.1 mannose-1-phosphate guanylyltransferase [Zhouia amylolytica]
MQHFINVILSGGSGTRLWPLSRQSNPKQFLKLFQGKSLFQNTLERNKDFSSAFMLITNETQKVMADVQARELHLDIKYKIIEPVGRNTAPAIALACLSVHPDAILFVTPSDHMIDGRQAYQNAFNRAVELAQEGNIVTFGIDPLGPETGFGYIEARGETVVSFREKPDLKTAKEFLTSGNFLWNSGMFCFKAGVFLEELEKYHPEMLAACSLAYSTIENGLVDLEAMKAIPADSIDYAVLEKSEKVKVVPSSFYWTDLGTFDALINYSQLRQNQVDVLKPVEGCNNAFAFTDKKVVANGVDNIVLVETDDVMMVLPVGESNRVKSIYNNIKENDSSLID